MTSRRSFLGWLAGALAGCTRAVRREPSEPSTSDPTPTPPTPTRTDAADAEAAQTAEPPSDLFAGAPAADDPLELLYSRRLSFEEGQPLVTVRVAEGRHEMAISARGPFLSLPLLPAIAEPLPCRLSTQDLVDLLKMPTCFGNARQVVLKHLGNRYHRRFVNHWEFVRYAKEQNLDLDFTTPPRRPNPKESVERMLKILDQ